MIPDLFYNIGTRIAALPNWHQPRLIFPATKSSRNRLRYALSYPAFKKIARLYRYYLGTKAFTGHLDMQISHSDNTEFLEFLRLSDLGVVIPVIIIGTPGPTQKLTLKLYDQSQQVVGYLKFGESPICRQRLQQEENMLRTLPVGLGPKFIKSGSIGNGWGLLITPVPGNPMSPYLPSPKSVWRLLTSLIQKEAFAIDKHPRIVQLMKQSPEVEKWLSVLKKYQWPICYEHGDFAPWNLLQHHRKLCAIDWEYGHIEGFPFFDIIYYYTQVAWLVYRWSPEKTLMKLKSFMIERIISDYNGKEVNAIIVLALTASNNARLKDGHPVNDKMIQWRKQMIAEIA